MKIEFDPLGDELDEVRQMLDGWIYRRVLQELDEYLKLSIDGSDMTDHEQGAYLNARDRLYRSCENRGVTVWD